MPLRVSAKRCKAVPRLCLGGARAKPIFFAFFASFLLFLLCKKEAKKAKKKQKKQKKRSSPVRTEHSIFSFFQSKILVFFCFWLLPFSKKEKEKHSHLHLLLHLAIHLQRVSDPLRFAVQSAAEIERCRVVPRPRPRQKKFPP